MKQLLPLSLLALALALSTQARATDAVEIITTADGIRFGIWPSRPAKPAPTLFVFAAEIEGTLAAPYTRQAGHFMEGEGVVFVSIDLPCHGKDVRPKESAGLSGWRARAELGEDFMADFTGKAKRVLDELIKLGMTDPEHVAALGTSRGGYAALQFAAADARVRNVMGFAPVTDLAALSEFRGAEELEVTKRLSLINQASALADRGVWVVIGDRDARVSTDAVITFVRAVTKAAMDKKLSPQADLHVIAEPKGHTVPKGLAEIGAAWLRERLLPKPAK